EKEVMFITKFFDFVPKLFVYEDYEEILRNIKQVIIEEGILSEVKVYNFKQVSNFNKYDLVEVPCLIMNKNYYYKDVLFDKNKLKVVLSKHAKG
ncbi:hypothetical protein D6777_01960, partial [Candidatus Woesearchaeota archaeon]